MDFEYFEQCLHAAELMKTQNSEPKLTFKHKSTELLITNQSNEHDAHQESGTERKLASN